MSGLRSARRNPIAFYGSTIVLSSALFITVAALERFRSALPLESGGHVIDAPAYDLLFGTICGGGSVALALYFAAIATLLVVVRERAEGRVSTISSELYTSGYLIAPFVLLELAMLLLGAHAFGGHTYHWALPAYLLLGVASTISFARLGELVYSAFSLQVTDGATVFTMTEPTQSQEEALPIRLGRLHTQVWRAHDAENFEGLVTAASRFYVELGHDLEQARMAAECLGGAYQRADCAEDAAKKHDVRRELVQYGEAASLMIRARRTLHCSVLSGLIEAAWWHAFRHRWTRWSLTLLQFDMLLSNWHTPQSALKAADRVDRAADAHLSHDWKRVEQLLAEHWTLCLVANMRPLVGGI